MRGLELQERLVCVIAERRCFVSGRSRSALCNGESLGVQELLKRLNIRAGVQSWRFVVS